MQSRDDFFILLDSKLIQDKLINIFSVHVAKYGISNKRDLETVVLLHQIANCELCVMVISEAFLRRYHAGQVLT